MKKQKKVAPAPPLYSLFLLNWLFFFRFHISDTIWYLSLFISRSTTSFRFIHVTNSNSSFFFILLTNNLLVYEIYIYMYTYICCIFFICPSIDENLTLFHFLPTVNAAVNIGVQISLRYLLYFLQLYIQM